MERKRIPKSKHQTRELASSFPSSYRFIYLDSDRFLHNTISAMPALSTAMTADPIPATATAVDGSAGSSVGCFASSDGRGPSSGVDGVSSPVAARIVSSCRIVRVSASSASTCHNAHSTSIRCVRPLSRSVLSLRHGSLHGGCDDDRIFGDLRRHLCIREVSVAGRAVPVSDVAVLCAGWRFRLCENRNGAMIVYDRTIGILHIRIF